VHIEYHAEVGTENQTAGNVGAEPMGSEAWFAGTSLVAREVVLAVQHQDYREVHFEEARELGQKIDLGIYFQVGMVLVAADSHCPRP